MKTILIATIVLLPCLAVLNQTESIVPNILGYIYCAGLFMYSKTRAGKYYSKKLIDDIDRINNKIFRP